MYMFYASFGATAIAMVSYILFAFVRRRVRVLSYATSAGPIGRQATAARSTGECPSCGAYNSAGRQTCRSCGRSLDSAGTAPSPGAIGMIATMFTILGLVFLTFSLVFRTIVTGHGPFSNMFEFSLAFAWGIMLAYLYMEFRSRYRVLGTVVLPWALIMMWYATTVSPDVQPLVPALQNNLLLSVHVAVAIIAYGTFAVGFGAAVLYLVQRNMPNSVLPSPDALDDLGYRTVIIGFPMMFLVIILGALWADVAWGSYWSWDPKETASLVTWLIYGGYLHARVMRGWRGTRSAVLLLIGFAATLFTYFGNLFFSGLHSYSGLG